MYVYIIFGLKAGAKMSDFILNFFRGRLNPPYKTLLEHRKSNEQEQISEELMQKLIGQLTKEQIRLLLDFVNARDAVWYESEEESFMLGFRIGSKFAQDAFRIEDDAIEDLFVFEY